MSKGSRVEAKSLGKVKLSGRKVRPKFFGLDDRPSMGCTNLI